MGTRYSTQVHDHTPQEHQPEIMSKALLRTSSGSYPYPRTHTTVMVLPSQRPVAAEDRPGFGAIKAVRRPALNRSCPPIPESKSNESIKTQASDRVEKVITPVEDKCVIIENVMAEKVSRIPAPKAHVPRSLTSTMPRAGPSKERTAATDRQDPPRSPLLSVAHSVRSKLSKLGRLGRSQDSATERNIKGSQSMSSMRPAGSGIPRRAADMNDNYRMAKSASMETPSHSTSSEEPKSKLRPPTKIDLNRSRKSLSKEESAEKAEKEKEGKMQKIPEDTIAEQPTKTVEEVKTEKVKTPEVHVKKEICIVKNTFNQAAASIRMHDEETPKSSVDFCVKAPERRPDVSLKIQGLGVSFEGSGMTTKERADHEEDAARADDLGQDFLSSPEDEIPMDTHLTPTDDKPDTTAFEVRQISDETITMVMSPAKSTHSVQSTSTEGVSTTSNAENIAPKGERQKINPPVFNVPSPPTERITMEHKSTSPLKKCKVDERNKDKKDEHHEKKEGMTARLRHGLSRDKSKERDTEKGKQHAEVKEQKAKTPRTPLSARSIRNATKMLAPSFLKKSDSKQKTSPRKPPPTSKSMPLSSPKSQLTLPVRFRKTTAPLAESESSVVENSPAVEMQPLRFDKWDCSPRSRRRYSERPTSQLALKDNNGNRLQRSKTVSRESATRQQIDNQNNEGIFHDPGLIDDEIQDQPMLVGDLFPTSESMDRIQNGTILRASFEPDASTIMSIDRSTVDDNSIFEPRRSYHDTQPSTVLGIHPVYTTSPQRQVYEQEQIDLGLRELEAMRAQLRVLTQFVGGEEQRQQKSGIQPTELVRENDILRQQLMEKDEVINQLRAQLETTKLAAS